MSSNNNLEDQNNLTDNENLDEKNFYDKDSAPIPQNIPENIPHNIPQNLYNYQNPQYYNNPNYIYYPQYYTNYNSNFFYYPQKINNNIYYDYQYNQQISSYNNLIAFSNEKPLIETNGVFNRILLRQFAFSYILIAISLIDIIIQIIIKFFNIFNFCDDISITFLSIIFLIYSCSRKNIKNLCLGCLTVLIWLIGFAIRGIGIGIYASATNKKKAPFYIPIIALILFFIRTIILFLCIPLTCNQRK